MDFDTRLGEQIERYLDLSTGQIKLTAANMSNIDTPGYRTVGIDFDEQMRRAMEEVNRALPPSSPQVSEVDGLVARPDGNNVSMDRESLTLARSQLQFKIGVALLREQNQMLSDAIHADK